MKNSIFEMYEKEKMGHNALCMQCRENSNVETMAQSPYLIAESIHQNGNLLFIGKIARGDCIGKKINEYFEDVTDFGNEFIHNSHWAFYAYTREIIRRIYNDLDEGLKFVSLINITKCNDNSNKDTTDYSAKEYCIRRNGFIWKEINILKPSRIIFYTGKNYDNHIEEFRPVNCNTYKDVYDRQHVVEVGNKYMPWWDRQFFDSVGNIKLKFLRVGHPERKAKEEFIEQIVKWLH